jgi:hypothetical protein
MRPTPTSDVSPFWNPRVRATLLESVGVLDALLKETFPGSTVVVLDRFVGFRAHRDQFVLLVEAFGGQRPGSHVVKIGQVKDVDTELEAWKSCAGEVTAGVFLPVEAGKARPRRAAAGGPRLKTLLYPEAAKQMHTETTMSLHAAALQAVIGERPAVASVCSALRAIYAEAARRFYVPARPSSPADKGYVLDVPKLDEGLDCWYGRKGQAAELMAVRLVAGSILEHNRGPGCFLSPVVYLRYVREHFRPDGSVPIAGSPHLPAAALTDVVPEMARGRAHGDLHDRNVVVGVDGLDVPFVRVYDHENMGPDNLIGWDFVKMEFEFKIRAYERILKPLSVEELVKLVQLVEIELAELVERYYREGKWPEIDKDGPPTARRLDKLVLQVAPKLDVWRRGELVLRLQRLAAIILSVRHCAADYLGSGLGRPRRWLEEYYFLLAAYCVQAGRFENPDRRERLAGFVAAGVAAARLSWPRKRFDLERHVLGLDGGEPAVRTADAALALPVVWHDNVLEAARAWARGGAAGEAVQLLRELHARYPRAPRVLRELAFACRQAGLAEEELRVDEQLRALHKPEELLDEEALMEHGKQPKKRGVAAFLSKAGRADLMLAFEHFEQAAVWYERAYGRRSGHYPGVNLATMRLLMAAIDRHFRRSTAKERLKEARGLAAGLFERQHDWPKTEPDDDVWHAASRGECLTILGEFDAAFAEYDYARHLPSCKDTHRRIMGKQLRLLLEAYRLLGQPPPTGMTSLADQLDPEPPAPSPS